MPSGLHRFQDAGSLHFITFSCFHRLPLLLNSGSKDTVEAVLETTRARYSLQLYAYVLMPEHVHLLLNEPPQMPLAQFVKSLKQMTSRKLKNGLSAFWQDRYYDRNIYDNHSASEVIDYIHFNPVKRGLILNPEDWQWSSFRHYATGLKGAVEIESFWTAMQRGNQFPDCISLHPIPKP